MQPVQMIDLLKNDNIQLAIAEHCGDITRVHYIDQNVPTGTLLDRYCEFEQRADEVSWVELVYLANPNRGEFGWAPLPCYPPICE